MIQRIPMHRPWASRMQVRLLHFHLDQTAYKLVAGVTGGMLRIKPSQADQLPQLEVLVTTTFASAGLHDGVGDTSPVSPI